MQLKLLFTLVFLFESIDSFIKTIVKTNIKLRNIQSSTSDNDLIDTLNPIAENIFEDLNEFINIEPILSIDESTDKVDTKKKTRVKKEKVAKEPKEPKVKAEKKLKLSPKEKLKAKGFVFSDEEGDYDVPIIKDAMWYRLSVRKNSEKKLCELMMNLKQTRKWASIIEDAYYPQTLYVKFKGNALTCGVKPMLPGIVYFKIKMGPGKSCKYR